jgi:hypothetical protein
VRRKNELDSQRRRWLGRDVGGERESAGDDGSRQRNCAKNAKQVATRSPHSGDYIAARESKYNSPSVYARVSRFPESHAISAFFQRRETQPRKSGTFVQNKTPHRKKVCYSYSHER